MILDMSSVSSKAECQVVSEEKKLSQSGCLDFSLKNTYLIKDEGIRSMMRWKATVGFGPLF